LSSPHARDCFEQALEEVRQRYQFMIGGYVVMPEHVHLLISEPDQANLATALQVLKQKTSRQLKPATENAFWQRRYYDFNVWSAGKFREKLKYIHRNPVRRCLVRRPED
jgi:REP-associated tyrosine transposase